jgi:hypothetical protein
MNSDGRIGRVDKQLLQVFDMGLRPCVS